MTAPGLGGIVRFGPFRLDPGNLRLWRGDEVARLTPKALAVLAVLVSRPGQLVSKDELLTAIWPGVTVTEAALTVCIREIRRALDDDARRPRMVETVHRHGFRFIGRIGPDDEALVESPPRLMPARFETLVAREAEAARLHEWLGRARSGERQVAFVTGEAGIGKTALVESFLAGLAGPDAPWIGRGQCIEYLGAGEAYVPVLDALGRLARTPAGARIVPALAQHAPSWLVQMPGLVGAEEMDALQRRAGDPPGRRMPREITDAIEALTAAQPLVLVLEDLHWSDHATLDLIAWLARRREPARLLVIGTYRPVEAIVRAHPLRGVVQELMRQRRASELALELLDEAAIGRYLALRFEGGDLPSSLVGAIHRHTDGNPLFMVTVVDDLVRQRWLALADGRWQARPGAERAATAVPPSLAQMVEQQFEGLAADDQQALEAASAAGLEFSAAAAAAGAEAPPAAVEARCAALARRAHFLRAAGSEVWPDGTVSGRYRFTHALHRQVVYERLPAGRRAQVHRRVGLRLEAGYGDRAGERAGDLARHFLEGQDVERALDYLRRAATNAEARGAYREAINDLTQGLQALADVPESADRLHRELDFESVRAPLLAELHGFAAPEAERAYQRARELAAEAGDAPRLLRALWGLWRGRMVRGQIGAAREAADQLLALDRGDPSAAFLAHLAKGATLYLAGDLVRSREHLDRSAALYRSEDRRRPDLAAEPSNQRVTPLRYGALALWALGYPDQAVERLRAALAIARDVADVPGVAATHVFLARLHQFRGEPAPVREHAEATMTIAREQGFLQRLAAARVLDGWARIGQDAAGAVEAMARGLHDFKATGAGDDVPYWLALLAEGQLAAGQVAAAIESLDEALEHASESGLRVWESEIHRLRGDAHLAGAAGPPASPQRDAAARSYREALAVARRQQARSNALRAATSLARLEGAGDRGAEARAVLAEICGGFTEGFDTADFVAARSLLDEPGGAPPPPRRSRGRARE